MKQKRGIFIDLEGLNIENFDDNFDENILNDIGTTLNTKFQLFIFDNSLNANEEELEAIKKGSQKLYERALLMLEAGEIESKRKDLLRLIYIGCNIITINYCFDKITKSLGRGTDLNFAKKLFRGNIRPDIIISYNNDKIKEVFNDYQHFIYEFKNDKEISINNLKEEIILLYKNTMKDYENNNNEYKKNFYPFSIGEDLFIDWTS